MHTCTYYYAIHMTLMMTSAQVVETSVNVTNNSPSWDYSHPDDQTTQTTETPGFKPFTVVLITILLYTSEGKVFPNRNWTSQKAHHDQCLFLVSVV